MMIVLIYLVVFWSSVLQGVFLFLGEKLTKRQKENPDLAVQDCKCAGAMESLEVCYWEFD